MKLVKLIQEKKTDAYEYGCVMLYFDFPLINKIHDAIDPDDLYEEEGDRTYGLEDEPHCTLLFGLHPVALMDIKKVLARHKFGPCKVYNASLFQNEKYDVLKFDVGYASKGDNFLHKCNEDLKKFPYTNSFPNYHPHLTIGYLKPGFGKKYAERLKGFESELAPQYAVYSKPPNTKHKIAI